MDTEAIDKLARYYRDGAERGLGACRNTHKLAVRLGLTPGRIQMAFMELVKTGRLEKRRKHLKSIDGVPFKPPSDTTSGAAYVAQVLRRRFSPVVDSRFVDAPDSVPDGPPFEFIVGARRLPAAYAAALATIIASPCSSMRAA